MSQLDLLCGRKPLGTIAYISSGFVHEQFTFSLAQLIQACYEYIVPEGHYLHLDHSTASGQANARNELVSTMQGDWMLQLDSDHDFEPDLLIRMLQLFEGQDLDVLSGLYNFKQKPHNPVLFQYANGQYHSVSDWGGEACPRNQVNFYQSR